MIGRSELPWGRHGNEKPCEPSRERRGLRRVRRIDRGTATDLADVRHERHDLGLVRHVVRIGGFAPVDLRPAGRIDDTQHVSTWAGPVANGWPWPFIDVKTPSYDGTTAAQPALLRCGPSQRLPPPPMIFVGSIGAYGGCAEGI